MQLRFHPIALVVVGSLIVVTSTIAVVFADRIFPPQNRPYDYDANICCFFGSVLQLVGFGIIAVGGQIWRKPAA